MGLPPLYSLDDYWSCVAKDYTFCTFKAYLTNTTQNNPIWNQIQILTSDPKLFDRTLLHRAICIPKEYSQDVQSQRDYSRWHLSNEISHLNLTATVDHFACIESPKLTTYDYTVLGALLCYYIFFIAVSVYDKWIIKNKHNDQIIWNFSLFYNWRKMINSKNGRDYDKLKSMQGLRFFLTANTIFVHTLLSYAFVYLDDPVLLEQKFIQKYGVFLLSFSHGVQPFFLLSSWLCTLQIYNTYEDNGKISFRDILVIIVNRYFRLIPMVAFMCILLSTNIPTLITSSPHLYYPLRVFQSACQNNMLPTLMFMNNHYYVKDMCNPVTWYLSADFQYYVLTSILVYLILKYKWNVAKVLGIVLLASWVIYGSIIYVHGLDMMFRIHIRVVELAHFLDSEPFRMSNAATHASLTTPLVGIMFGFIYVQSRHRTHHISKILVATWYISISGLLAITLYLSTKHYSPVPSAILGPLFKPVYALCFGIGILGMSHNIGGIIKRLFEWRFAEIMANFCFGAYMTHVAFCFTRGLNSYTLYPAIRLETDFFIDLVFSFITGTMVSLSIEQPASVLLKKILPQIQKKSKTVEQYIPDKIPSHQNKQKFT